MISIISFIKGRHGQRMTVQLSRIQLFFISLYNGNKRLAVFFGFFFPQHEIVLKFIFRWKSKRFPSESHTWKYAKSLVWSQSSQAGLSSFQFQCYCIENSDNQLTNALHGESRNLYERCYVRKHEKILEVLYSMYHLQRMTD